MKKLLTFVFMMTSIGGYAQKYSVQDIDRLVSEMTLQEKIAIVMGKERHLVSPPDAAPGMIKRPAPDYSNLSALYTGMHKDDDKVVAAFTEGRVKGAAGENGGVKRLNIPLFVYADGPAGLRIDITRPDDDREYYCTAFPVGVSLSSTWDVSLVERVCQAMGNEVKEYGVDVLLAPGMNIMRNPLCGRNFEYFSEDPFLTGKIASAYVRGIQSQGVGVSVKHFAVNNQETFRNGIDVHVTERAMREIYLKAFEMVVKEAKPWTIMSSYNKINGVLASENRWLLTDLLRKEWGFDGFVMTDWWAEEDGARQIAAGNDLLMPGTQRQVDDITAAVNCGRLDESFIDDCVKRILYVMQKSPSCQQYEYSNQPDLNAHAHIVRQASSEGMVLLKNNGALPFKGKSVTLVGVDAYDALVGGSGSGNVNRRYKISLDQGFANTGIKLEKALSTRYLEYIKQEKSRTQENFWTVPIIEEIPISREEAEQAARKTDIAILVIGRMAGEGSDRQLVKGDYYLSDVEQQNLQTLCQAFHEKKKKVVVVMNMGSTMHMADWHHLPDAILMAWMGGQETGNSMADVLTGKVCPSGKLPMTIAQSYKDYPSADNFPFSRGTESEVCYDEDIFVGYRHFDTHEVKPLYPFGFGLSYTNFEYSNMQVAVEGDLIKVSVTVKNTGGTKGKEIVQLYVGQPDGIYPKAVKELKSFAKTSLLKPGASETLNMTIKKENLGSWNSREGKWVIEKGTYRILCGASVEDIREKAEIRL